MYSPKVAEATLPPTFSEASSTVTSLNPYSFSFLAAESPATPAPITTIHGFLSAICNIEEGITLTLTTLQIYYKQDALLDSTWYSYHNQLF